MKLKQRPLLFLLSLSCLVFLTQCGFKPLYTSNQGGTLPALASVNVAVIEDRDGQLLRNALLHSMTPRGIAENPLYTLKVTIEEGVENFGILKDATTSQTQFTFKADFVLLDRCTRAELFKGKSTSTANYNTIPTSPFSTLTEADYAKKKAIESLALDIRRQVAAFFLLGPPKAEKEDIQGPAGGVPGDCCAKTQNNEAEDATC